MPWPISPPSLPIQLIDGAPALDYRALEALTRTLLATLVRDLAAMGERSPHIYTLNSAAVLGSLEDAGYRPLKHRI